MGKRKDPFREAQRRMYLRVTQLEYAPAKKRRERQELIRKCLNSHKEGCDCWRKAK